MIPNRQSQVTLEEMTLEVDLSAIKGSPRDQDSVLSIGTDDDSQQSINDPHNGSVITFENEEGFPIMASSAVELNESESQDETSNISHESTGTKLAFTCEICFKVFQKRSRLLSHMVTHSEQKDHICAVCGKGFKNKPQLRRHSHTHSEVPNFCCNICGRGFKHNDVAKHIRRWHSGPRKSNRGAVTNPEAMDVSQYNLQLKRKRRAGHLPQQSIQEINQPTHHQNLQSIHEQSSQCIIIQSQVPHQGIVQLELQSDGFSDERDKEVKEKLGMLQEHQVAQQHSLNLGECPSNALNGGSDDSPLVCTSGQILFPCPECNLSFEKHQELTCHMVVHKEINGEVTGKLKKNKKHHQCHLCHKTFTRASGLAGHMQLHTRTERRKEPNPDLRCHICGKIFTRRAGLNAHVLQHGGILRFWCDEPDCGKGFVHSYQMIRHKHVHSEVPPYSCEVCGRAFRHNDLAKHMRTHTGVKPYNCQHCGKAFAFNSSLRAHERMHLALKDHLCEVCNMGFTTSAGLRRHAKCHEDEEEELCSFCRKLFPSKLHLNLHLQESQHCADQQQQHNQQQQQQQQQDALQSQPLQLMHHLQETSQTQSQTQPVQHIHEQQVQHLQVLPVQHLVHSIHDAHQDHHPMSIHVAHNLDSHQLTHTSNTTNLATLAPASEEPVGLDPTSSSAQALPVLVPFSVSVPLSVPFGVNLNSTTTDQVPLNHFLGWEQKY